MPHGFRAAAAVAKVLVTCGGVYTLVALVAPTVVGDFGRVAAGTWGRDLLSPGVGSAIMRAPCHVSRMSLVVSVSFRSSFISM